MKLQTETKMKAMNFQTQILTLQFTHISAHIHTHTYTFKFIYTIINPFSIHTLHFTLQFFFLPAFVMANV